MNSDNSTISQLREMISLEEKRDQLIRDIRACDARLISLRTSLNYNRSAVPAKPDLSGAKSSTRAGHGSLKREILVLLQKAGSEGISVREISSFLTIKSANIYAWFHSTGRTIPQIEKIGEARYALNGELPPEPEATLRPVSPDRVAASQPRGGLTKKIFSSLEQAGDEGVTVKQLADLVESNYRNVAVWFATTGKKFTNIKKIAPAHYRIDAAPSTEVETPSQSEQAHQEEPPQAENGHKEHAPQEDHAHQEHQGHQEHHQHA